MFSNKAQHSFSLGFCILTVVLILIGGVACSPGGEEPTSEAEIGAETASEPTQTALLPAQPATFTALPATNTPITQAPITPTATTTATTSLTTTTTVTPTTTLSPTVKNTPTTPPELLTPTGVAGTFKAGYLNGIPEEEIIVMTPEVIANVQAIYARGQLLGRNGQAFSKLGDSLIATPSFLTQFDTGNYDLGPYADLQPAIDFFAGSFERYGVALRPGLHAWGVFDPLWANKDWCQANEDLLACEIRLNNPSVLLILLGTNDAGNPPGFDYNMRKVIDYTIEKGIVPVIVTKADRFEGPDNVNNEILRQIAADYQVPLWDFDLVAGTLPNRGLADDQVHLSVFPENDYNLPAAYQTGHGIHNLTGLMMLEEIRQAIAD